nr:hypothetical protein OsI_32187 [Ipomoea batatas]
MVDSRLYVKNAGKSTKSSNGLSILVLKIPGQHSPNFSSCHSNSHKISNRSTHCALKLKPQHFWIFLQNSRNIVWFNVHTLEIFNNWCKVHYNTGMEDLWVSAQKFCECRFSNTQFAKVIKDRNHVLLHTAAQNQGVIIDVFNFLDLGDLKSTALDESVLPAAEQRSLIIDLFFS